MNDSKRNINCIIKCSVWQALRAEAFKQESSVSKIVNNILDEYVEKIRKENKMQ